MTYVIGIDIGTSGTKAILVNRRGEVVDSFVAEYAMSQPQNGYAEQNPEDWYNAVKRAVKHLCASVKNTGTIKAIGLTGQMHGLVMLDSDNAVIRPAILWCDTRTQEQCDELSELIGKQQLLGITANPAVAGFTAAKIMWVKKYEPQNFAKCKKILLPKDYVRFRMSGDFATDVSDASGMQLLNVKNRCWSEVMLNKLGLSEDMLAKCYESSEITGKVTPEFARACGLSEDVVIVAGAGDNAAAAVGTGVVWDNRAFTTIGSSGVLFAHTSEMKLDKKGRVHTFCSAVSGEWHVMGVTQGAGLSLKWFKDNFCSEEVQVAAVQGVDVYEIIDKLADTKPIGAERLLYLPYLMGERTPHLDTNARGVFFGLSASHTKANMIRAVLEGVSYSLKDCSNVLLEMGVSTGDMMLCGGGAKSRLWQKMLADVYGCDIKLPASNEGAALGAAILAMVGVGEYKDVREACDEIIGCKEVIETNKENIPKYNDVYNIYKGLYPVLCDEYKKLAKI